MFSIADLQSEDDMQNPEADEEGSEEAGDEAPYHAFPIRASLSITKTTGPGCISVDLVCQEGNLIVDNISYYKDAKVGTELTAEADWKRRGLYIGPQVCFILLGLYVCM
jgi:complement component 1 Q subcomponent-binding protein